jgi:hypothetical protein
MYFSDQNNHNVLLISAFCPQKYKKEDIGLSTIEENRLSKKRLFEKKTVFFKT